jgi:flagellar M-ring protein FliF
VWRNLGAKGQLGVVASALLVVITMFFLYRTAAKPSYTTLLTNVDASESAQIADALAAGGITYKLDANGTQISVRSGQESQARVALAKKGLPDGGHVGFELFDKQSFGATDFQQRVNYQRALEGEIARTIESINGVEHADVQLVLPDDSLFVDQQANASAAVLLTGGSQLDEPTISGIAHLVASSVKRLSASDVTVTDNLGNLLWPQGDGVAGDMTKMEAQQRYDAQLSAQINALLTQTLGPGKAQARVHSDLNLDRATVDKVTFAHAGTPITSESQTEALKSKGAGAATPAGANVPATVTAGGGPSNYSHKTASTQYGVDKTVESRVIAPGAVNRLDVALLVDSSVPAAQVAALKSSVAALAGVTPRRGDTLAVSTIAFAKQTPVAAPKAGPLPAGALGILKWLGIAAGVSVLFFFVRRNLAKRERDPVALEPTWLREIEHAVPVAELEASTNGRVPVPNGRPEGLREQVEEIARKQPEQIAMQVGQWMKEG